jgi:signal peptidase I
MRAHKMSDTKILEDSKGNEFVELVKIALWAVLLATVIRSFMFEPFNIPSGSMKPTLLVGDYIFVTKYKYGYSKYSFPFSPDFIEGRVGSEETPKRGAVIVFRNPQQTNIDYIKRIVGMPGDRVQMKDGRLYINGEMVAREFVKRETVTTVMGTQKDLLLYKETLPNGVNHMIYEETDRGGLDNTREFLVPQGHYFVMGDNRDNSKDSRVYESVGPIPLDHIIGPANYVFFSTDGEARLWEIWNWPFATRFSRLFSPIQSGDLADASHN